MSKQPHSILSASTTHRHYDLHSETSPILEVKHASVMYDSGIAIKNIDFTLQRGDRIAVIGPNGAGKSTLLKIVAGVQSITTGSINIYGHEPGKHICIAFVPQRSQIDWQFPVSVFDVVMMGRIGQMGLFRRPGISDRRIVRNALSTVGIESLEKRQISQLSGGQQQRMFIARALAQQAELILLDEPLTGLDAQSQEGIFNILNELQQRQVTVMVSLHDLELASSHFNKVLLLNTSLIGYGAPDDVFTTENLMTAYGHHLHMVKTSDGLMALGDTCCEGDDAHV